MNRRKDFRDFQQILEKHNISRFYHFTDRDNIESIIKNGGLFSYGDCIKKGINIKRPGGSELSHELDFKENLQDYVRISICKRHPMMYYAIQDERIVNPVLLEIDTDILLIEGNIFSDKNAVRKDSNKGKSFADFNRIHFGTATKKTQFDVEEDEQDYFQAEILVPHCVPLHYITNLSEFQLPNSKEDSVSLRRAYSACISEDNPTSVLFILNQSYPTKEMITYNGVKKSKASIECSVIDNIINELIVRNTSNGILNDKYNISVIGYGDHAYNCLENNKNINSLKELDDNPISKREIDKEIITRHGIKTVKQTERFWTTPHSEGGAYLNYALKMVKKIAEEWIDKHPSSFPPIVIHITEYRYHCVDDCAMIQMVNDIKSLFTNDGNVLFFNIILSMDDNTTSVLFPTKRSDIGESYYGEMYYLMSSTLPISYYRRLSYHNDQDSPLEQRVGFALNVKLKDLYSTILSIIPQ